MQMPQGNPLLLSFTLQELLARDSVQVELIPEKKGLFLKHVEYEVSSQVAASCVQLWGWGTGTGLGVGKRGRVCASGSQVWPMPWGTVSLLYKI